MKCFCCDRCGAYYHEDDEIVVNKKNKSIRQITICTFCSKLDICPDCKRDFSKWFENITEE